jgi:alpha-tubulin suppressor-like RCC1 family protein
LIETLVNERIIKIASGSFFTIALTAEGDAFAWGSNKFG